MNRRLQSSVLLKGINRAPSEVKALTLNIEDISRALILLRDTAIGRAKYIQYVPEYLTISRRFFVLLSGQQVHQHLLPKAGHVRISSPKV
jgi:hypothetical protein